MARKHRLPYKCEYCQKRYASPQAKWGHYPQCEARNLSLGLASKPEAEAPAFTFVNGESRRPGPDGQEMKLLLLETQEEIIRLRNIADNNFIWAEFLCRAARRHVEGDATPEDWKKVYEVLGDVERDLDLQIGRLRLDRLLLFNIYHTMLAIQDAWLNYRTRDFSRGGELTPKGEEVLRVEQARFADLLSKIKRMVVAAR
jgi:hypothetical protein